MSTPVSKPPTDRVTDLTDPRFKKPFGYGWRRELVHRTAPQKYTRIADVYYYPPGSSRALRSKVQVSKILEESPDQFNGLLVDDFTFYPQLLGLDDPKLESVRDAIQRKPKSLNTSDSGKKNPVRECKKSFLSEDKPYLKISKKVPAKRILAPKRYDKFAKNEIEERLMKPFNLGWKRVVAFKEMNDNKFYTSRDIAYVCYLDPEGNKYRLKSEITPATGLEKENFTFFRVVLGLGDPKKEMIRYSKKYKKKLRRQFKKPSQNRTKGVLRFKNTSKGSYTSNSDEDTEFTYDVEKSNIDLGIGKDHKEPFDLGWKRVLMKSKNSSYITYISPEGKKCLNYSEAVKASNGLHKSNFTFTTKLIGINDPDKEFIRYVKGPDTALQACPKMLSSNHKNNIKSVVIDIFKKPFDYGWKRVLVLRASKNTSYAYYIAPDGTKCHHYDDINKLISGTDLEPANFSFASKLIGIKDPTKEYTRFTRNSTTKVVQPTYAGRKKNNHNYKNFVTTANIESLKKPFEYGWKRVLINSGRTYYISPEGRNCTKYSDILKAIVGTDLKLLNFSLASKFIGINDPEKEYIRRVRSKKDQKVAIKTEDPIFESPIPKLNSGKENLSDSDSWRKSPYRTRRSGSSKKMMHSDGPLDEDELSGAMEDNISNTSRRSARSRTNSETSMSSFRSLKRPATEPKLNGIAAKKSRRSKKLKVLNQKRMSNQCQDFFDTSAAFLDIYLNIFKFLDMTDLINVKSVCKTWKHYADHPSLWKSIKVKDCTIKDWDSFVQFLCYKNTKSLDLRKMVVNDEEDYDEYWEKFLAAIPNAISLIELNLCQCPLYIIDEVIKSCPHLSFLRLSQSNLPNFEGLVSVNNGNVVSDNLDLQMPSNEEEDSKEHILEQID